MSPAFIKGVSEHLPNARITFDKFHVIAHASTAVDKLPGASNKKTDPSLKGLRWALLKDRLRLSESQRANLDASVMRSTQSAPPGAWLYRENCVKSWIKADRWVSPCSKRWCVNADRSKVSYEKGRRMIRKHFDVSSPGLELATTNGFLEAIDGLFQAAKRKARGYGRFQTMRVVIFLVAGNLRILSNQPSMPPNPLKIQKTLPKLNSWPRTGRIAKSFRIVCPWRRGRVFRQPRT